MQGSWTIPGRQGMWPRPWSLELENLWNYHNVFDNVGRIMKRRRVITISEEGNFGRDSQRDRNANRTRKNLAAARDVYNFI